MTSMPTRRTLITHRQRAEQKAEREARALRKRRAAALRRAKIVDHYLEGHTLEETGKAFGITRERVRQILKMEGIDKRTGWSARRAQLDAEVAAVLPAALEAYKRGEHLNDIAKRLGVSANTLRAALQPHLTQLEGRQHKALRQQQASRAYTEAELLDALLDAKQAMGDKHLSVTRYTQWRKDRGAPGELTITKRFGSWNAALAAIGVEPKTSPKGFGAPRYTDEDLIAALRRVQVQHCDGGLPSIGQYSDHRMGDEPCAAAIRNRFGMWTKALALLEVEA